MVFPVLTRAPSPLHNQAQIAQRRALCHSARMRCLLLFLLFWPTFAAADWAPRPSFFSYDAAFALCTAEPNMPNPAETCKDRLSAAYVLKRAVAWATYRCHPESLTTCTLPFEDEGLPAIAAQIAVSAGCDDTDLTLLPEGAPIPPDHCAAITSDIMFDEGVVPLMTEITCNADWIECGELAKIHADLWSRAALSAAGNDTDLVEDLQSRNEADCSADARSTDSKATELARLQCQAIRSASLWADLARQTEQDN